MESSLLNIFLTNYILFEQFEVGQKWDAYGVLMIILVDLVVVAQVFYQFKLVNRQYLERGQIRTTQRFFGRYINDLYYTEIVEGRVRESRVVERLKMNYHLVGLGKKFVLFLVLVVGKERLGGQMGAIYGVLGGQLVLGVWLRPFKVRGLSYLRCLSDAVSIIYFMLIHLSDYAITSISKSVEESSGEPSQEVLSEAAET